MARAACRTQLTKLCKQVEEYLAKDEKVERELSVFLSRIKNIHSRLLKADVDYEKALKTELDEEEAQLALEYDDKAIITISQLEYEIENCNEKKVVECKKVEAEADYLDASGIKLRPIQPRKFDGNFENWIPFWEQFKVAVHENTRLEPSAKFNYLTEALTDKAAVSIKGLLPTKECYEDAVKSLMEEYGNKEKIVEKYVQKLISLKPVSSKSDVKQLRDLYNEITSTMRTLLALNVAPAEYNIMVYSILLKALPPSIKINFFKVQTDASNETTSLERLIAYIKTEVEALEKANISEKRTNYQTKGSAVSLFSSQESPNVFCVFCRKDSHETKYCKKNISIEEKKKILKENGRCFKCTKKNHNAKFCRNNWLKCNNCNGKHLTVMCERKKQQVNRNEAQTTVESVVPTTSITNTTSLNTIEEESKVFLQTARAILVRENEENVLTRVIMDNGSQRSYITEKLADVLKLQEIGVEKVKIFSFGENEKSKRAKHLKQVLLKIRSQFSDEFCFFIAAVVPAICADILPTPSVKNFGNFNVDNIADEIVYKGEIVNGINLLIGQDNYWRFNSNKNKYLKNNLVAVNTFFGWTLQGCLGFNDNTRCVLNIIENNSDDFDLTKFWSLETVGINSNTDEIAKITIENIRFEDGRYSVSLPWQIPKEKLHKNKNNAIIRLNSLLRNLSQNKAKMLEYDNGIQDLLNNGIAEVVNTSDKTNTCYYMPHRAVYRHENVTTKMRIVFDASSSEPGLFSLNEHLSSGSNLTADLIGTLLKFRLHKIAIVADIEKAFLQISLDENERDTHRFLWLSRLPNHNEPIPPVIELRMKRVTFGVTCSPFLLAATIRKHLELMKDRYGSICDELQGSFYVDDLVSSVSSSAEAKDIYFKGNEIMQKANFNLRKWNSNNIEMRNIISNGKEDVLVQQKVLGLIWYVLNDTIEVDLHKTIEYICNLSETKRSVMRAMARIYDPLGILAPFTVRLKILLQAVWKKKLNWDEPLKDDMFLEFVNWKNELIHLKEFQIDRKLTESDNSRKELHIYADASPKAYGVVAYLREELYSGEIKTKFIISKNRVSPINKNGLDELSIPKLELTAALIASRLKKFLISTFRIKFDSVTLWSDSNITLSWIRGQGKRIKPYITSRINEINNLTNIYDWNYCEGKCNPADLLTRGLKAKDLLNSDLWKNGPDWLCDRTIERKNHTEFRNVLTMLIRDETNLESNNTFELINRYSRLKKLLRVAAFILRFIKNLKRQNSTNSDKKFKKLNEVEELTAKEIYEAERKLVILEQKKYFGNEMATLQKKENVTSSSKIILLNPILDQGVLRIKGRLSESDYGSLSKPAILPKESFFTKLLVNEAHGATMHGGVNMVLAYIRKKYWVIQGRQLIKSVISRCVICKKIQGKSASEPWTVLPLERVMTTKPFATTGVDFAGPLYIQENSEGEQKKVYILLLTCAAIRAVHLELVSDMTVESFMCALRRFISRRGMPNMIMSDNAKTFKRASKELIQLGTIMSNNEVQQMMANKGISWKFIPERAAWWGGFWERLVKSVKIALKAAIGKNILTYDELVTLLTEIESVVNMRPLTYVSSDHKDLEPLTPSHFLIGTNLKLVHEEFVDDGSQISKLWQQRQVLVKRYMKRWQQEYVSQLRSVHQNKGGVSRSIRAGDVVLVHDQVKQRLLWKMAVVETTYPGRDGRVRACDVRLANKTILKRPIQLLYPLEIPSRFGGAEDVENSL